MQNSPQKTIPFRFYIINLIILAHVVGWTLFVVGPTLIEDLSLSITQFKIILVTSSSSMALAIYTWMVHVHKKTMGLRFSQKQKIIWWLCALIINPLSLILLYELIL